MMVATERLHVEITTGYCDVDGKFYVSQYVPEKKVAAANIRITNFSENVSLPTTLIVFQTKPKIKEVGRQSVWELRPGQKAEDVVRFEDIPKGHVPFRVFVGNRGLAEAVFNVK